MGEERGQQAGFLDEVGADRGLEGGLDDEDVDVGDKA